MGNLKDTLDRFGRNVVSKSKSNLTRKGHKDTGGLHSSLKYETKVNPNSIEVSISMADYGTFVDKGVKGFRSSSRAPKSPYKFGTGTGKKGGLTKGIDEWVKRKRFQFRDKKGRFQSFEQTSFMVRNAIWNKGLRATEFFTKPFEKAFKRLPDDVIEAYGLDVEKLMELALK